MEQTRKSKVVSVRVKGETYKELETLKEEESKKAGYDLSFSEVISKVIETALETLDTMISDPVELERQRKLIEETSEDDIEIIEEEQDNDTK